MKLRAQGVEVPYIRYATGGSIAPFDGGVLLLTAEGRILGARSKDKVFETGLKLPPDGFEAFLEVSKSEKYKGYDFRPALFRHIDLIPFVRDGRTTLAMSYIDYNKAQECYTTTVALLSLEDPAPKLESLTARPDQWKILFRTKPCLPLKDKGKAIEGHMAGGRLLYDGGGTLLLTSGDYYWDGDQAPEALEQKPEADYGKVLAIDIDTGTSRVVAMGTRNPQGIVKDAKGDIWMVEHGPRGGDELNRVFEGANFGWPLQSLGTGYQKMPLHFARSYGRHDEFVVPIYAWLPSVAPSTLTLINGFDPAWDGDILVGTLQDESLRRLRIMDRRVVSDERLEFGRRIRDVEQLPDGRIAVWTDDNFLYFLSVEPGAFAEEFAMTAAGWVSGDEARQKEAANVVAGCQECHSFDPNDSSRAPSLARIYSGPVAATAFTGYSEALRAKGGTWTTDRLREFLLNPEAFAPGTPMPNPGLDLDSANAIIEVLDMAEKELRTLQ